MREICPRPPPGSPWLSWVLCTLAPYAPDTAPFSQERHQLLARRGRPPGLSLPGSQHKGQPSPTASGDNSHDDPTEAVVNEKQVKGDKATMGNGKKVGIGKTRQQAGQAVGRPAVDWGQALCAGASPTQALLLDDLGPSPNLTSTGYELLSKPAHLGQLLGESANLGQLSFGELGVRTESALQIVVETM